MGVYDPASLHTNCFPCYDSTGLGTVYLRTTTNNNNHTANVLWFLTERDFQRQQLSNQAIGDREGTESDSEIEETNLIISEFLL